METKSLEVIVLDAPTLTPKDIEAQKEDGSLRLRVRHKRAGTVIAAAEITYGELGAVVGKAIESAAEEAKAREDAKPKTTKGQTAKA